MPLTGLIGGILEMQNAELGQQKAKQDIVAGQIDIEDRKAIAQQRIMALQQQRLQQQAMTDFFAGGMLQDQADKSQQQQQGQPPTRQQQMQQMKAQYDIAPPAQKMQILGQYMMSIPGMQQTGAAYLKEAGQLQKDQFTARKNQAQTAKLMAEDRGRVLAGLSDNPSRQDYEEAMKQIYQDQGTIPDWYTGDPQKDKPFIEREVKSFGYLANKKAAGLQHGLTENARIGAINRLQGMSEREAKPINQMLQNSQIARNLLQIGTPFGDSQLQLNLAELFRNIRNTNLMYKEGRNFGNLPRRVENLMARFFSGTLSDNNRKEIAEAIDEMDNKVFVPELNNVGKKYMKMYKDEKLGDNPEDVAPTNYTDLAGTSSAPSTPKGSANVGNQTWSGIGADRRNQAVSELMANKDNKKYIKSFKKHFGFLPPGVKE